MSILDPFVPGTIAGALAGLRAVERSWRVVARVRRPYPTRPPGHRHLPSCAGAWGARARWNADDL